VGKSTLCARLAGTIPGAVLLDADIHAEDLISVVSPNHDYPAFWRSMMRLAHEISQNNLVVVYFSVMLPEQILVNGDVLGYFDSVHFLCLSCSADVLRARLAGRVETGPIAEGTEFWVDFNVALLEAASEIPTATVMDADRSPEEVEHDVRHWISAQMNRPVNLRRARHDESGQLAEVWLRSRTASVPAIPPLVHSDEEVRAWFEQVVLPDQEVWVAQAGGEIVALLALNEDWIDQLYVDPSWTGKGIGSRLLGLAKQRRPAGLRLWTFQANAGARRFYESHGFVPTETTAGDNEEAAPDVRYDWTGPTGPVP